MIMFESEEAARGAAERLGTNLPDTVTLQDVQVREVVESATAGVMAGSTSGGGAA
jgi:hypothetical protein